jgi:glycosyltransferase involved in cell wall biosynthesis
MKITIITVCYNSASHIEDAIQSVVNQDFKEIEHIVIDGNSNDGTQQILEKYTDKLANWISEPDLGIYDAMNKGIKKATGDVVGILNSDDFYYDHQVISKVNQAFCDHEIDAVFGDLIVVDSKNLNKTIRTYSSKKWKLDKFSRGYMPAHPTFLSKGNFTRNMDFLKLTTKLPLIMKC